ncbi:MAG: glycosyltransferase [Gammaproteobacteria bacterium]|nr:glycosyltransferase [Gammaproteobacteria bacterium]MBU1724584.1 glycosyltransferase [Gammaproteobacteria bacterium]
MLGRTEDHDWLVREEVIKKHFVSDLSFVVATKNRPDQLHKLLESLSSQTRICGRVVVVGTGNSVEYVVSRFYDRLPVEYIHSPVPGQIRQRNMGIASLGGEFNFVGFLDDDLVLERDSLEKMIEFWNEAEPHTAGVGFNIINVEPLKYSWAQAFLFMSSSYPGRVLKSGYNVSIGHLATDVRSQWLGGGYTVWRSDILNTFPQDTLNTRWAIGEDLRFSYPIGKEYPLYVCADAKVRHEHVFDQAPLGKVHFYRGRKSAISQQYFVQLHADDFSSIACLWMIFGKSIIRLISAGLKSDHTLLFHAFGEMSGFLSCLYAAITSKSLRNDLED